jgi:hypothetical protein
MIAAVSEQRITLDVPALTGTWKNTNAASRGVVRLDRFDCRDALAFNCVFDLGVKDVRLQANIKAGVLVIVFLTRFHDERANVFTREFYYRSAQ